MHIRKMTIAASMVAALVGATSASTAADAARCVPAGWTLASGNAGCAKNGPWAERGLAKLDSEKARLKGLKVYFGHATVGWDTNPRYPEVLRQVVTCTPAEFEKSLCGVKDWCDRNTPPGYQKFISINAWNEWIEGSYLEPDDRNGTGYLDAVKKVFLSR